MKIGAHVSISGGIGRAVERIASMGGNTLQIFSSSPRTWQGPSISREEAGGFQELCRRKGVSPVFVHAKYLISLGNKSRKIQQKSVRSLIQDLEVAERIGAKGVIFHPNGEDFQLIVNNTKKVLERAPQNPCLIVENTARSSLEWLSRLFKGTDSEKLKFCLDTAHTYEAGYDLSKKKVFQKLLGVVEGELGRDKLVVVHANDSKTPLGSHNDKHEDIGEGELGLRAFDLFLRDERTNGLPFILETPGLKDKGGLSGREGIKLLKSRIKK